MTYPVDVIGIMKPALDKIEYGVTKSSSGDGCIGAIIMVTVMIMIFTCCIGFSITVEGW